MARGKQQVTVKVGGQSLVLRAGADDTYVNALAKFVTEKMDEAKSGSRQVSTQPVALLAAMNIADELFQLRASHVALKKNVKERSHKILGLLAESSSQKGAKGSE